MNYSGILLGLGVFLMVGMFHPIVIKAEYYWGKQIWPIFATAGLISLIVSILTMNFYTSAVTGALAFSLFWSVIELFKQDERVKLGRAKRNPKREYKK